MKVGDTVFVVKRGGKETYTATIKAFGRKWATLNSYDKFDVNTLELDGGRGYSSPGRVYLSEDDYNQSVALENLWRNLRSKVLSLQTPSLEQMQSVASILGIKME